VSINEIRNSREAGAARWHVAYPSILDFAAADRQYHEPAKTCVELLDDLFPPNHPAAFTYSSWSKGLRWENEDGSHRFAGAILAAHADSTSYLIQARIAIESLDRFVIDRLASRFAAFLLPAIGDPSSQVLPAPVHSDTETDDHCLPDTDRLQHPRRLSSPCFDLKALLRDARIPYRTATITHYIRKRDVIFLPYTDSKARRVARQLAGALRPPRAELFATLHRMAREQTLQDYLRDD